MRYPTSPAIGRRRFLKQSAAAAGALSLPLIAPSSVFGSGGASPPSERITVGLIGKGVMGSGHLRRLLADPAVELIGLCEVDGQRLEDGLRVAEAHRAGKGASGSGKSCVGYRDYREMLDRPDLDGVVIVTPDHWHALQAIDAARAGKDVYCEKPVSMTVEEGRRIVETVQRYGRVFQTGSQYRSIPTIRRACQFVRDGRLGKIKAVFTLLHSLHGFMGAERFRPYDRIISREKCGQHYVPLDFPLPEETVPAGLDWEMWVGPAAWQPYNRLYHVNPAPGVVPWSFAEAFGVTSLTWHLAHSADVIQFALGMEVSGPVEVIHPDRGEFPTLTCRYANGTLLHFVDHWGMVKEQYQAVPSDARLAGNFGGIFVGERGWLTSMTTGGPIEGGPDDVLADFGEREVNIGANDHHANWFECIRTRKKPSSHEEIGHRSASLGHLTNIAFWTGRSLSWDPAREEFANDEIANRLLGRPTRPPWTI